MWLNPTTKKKKLYIQKDQYTQIHNMSKYVHILSNCKYVYENLLFNNSQLPHLEQNTGQ